jgi:Putative Zn-dependent protease, contains TPR repeats
MPEQEARRLLAAAIAAGEKRDYRKAVDCLNLVLAQTDAMPEAFLYLGRSYYALGEFGRSIEAFRRFLASGGDEAAGGFFLGRAYLASGLPVEASRCLKRSAQADPDRAPTWAFLGLAMLKRHKTKLAVECLERAVGLAPEDGRIYRGYLNAIYGRGVRVLAKGDADMARQLFGFALANGLDGAAIRLWNSKALRECGRVPEALAECEAALALAPGDPSIRWLRAGLLLAAGRQAEALAEFDAIRAKHPELPALPADDVSLARLRASVAFRDGKYKEAVADALPLLRANPKDAALRSIAAESLRALGELERARDHWLRAIEAEPEEGEFRLGLALVLYDLGDYEAALQAAERGRKLGADQAEVDYYAALCSARLGKGSDSLIPKLQGLLRSPGRAGDPRLMFALGEALYRSGRPDLSGGWFEKVLMLAPDHELSLLYRISVAESLEDEEARLEAYAAYLATYPDNQKMRREYVLALAASESWAATAEAIEAGLIYAKPDLRMRRLLASSYRRAGRYREAAVAYRDMLREEPSSGELLVGLASCLERDGKAKYALALLEKAPAAAKAGAGPWLIQAALYDRQGKGEAAAKALRAALERDSGNAKAWENLAALYRRQGLVEMAANVQEEAAKALAARAAASIKAQNQAKGAYARGKAARAQGGASTNSGVAQPREGDDMRGLADLSPEELDIRSRRRGG